MTDAERGGEKRIHRGETGIGWHVHAGPKIIGSDKGVPLFAGVFVIVSRAFNVIITVTNHPS